MENIANYTPGEKLAYIFWQSRDAETSKVVAMQFFRLSIEEQGRFISYLAGAINAKNQNEALR